MVKLVLDQYGSLNVKIDKCMCHQLVDGDA